MLESLPDRPLTGTEMTALAESDAIALVFPATPDSIETDEDGTETYRDLLLFIEDTVTSVAYDEEEGWVIVARETEGSEYEPALEAILDYREYDVDHEEALEAIISELMAHSGFAPGS